MDIKECSFCGNPVKEGKYVEGLNALICSDCIDVCNEELGEDIELTGIINFDSYKPHIIKSELDKYVIGQESAKKIISVAAYNHYKRLNIKSRVDVQKTNVLLQGPTGTGKTYLVEILSKILDVPLIIIDANTFTEAGYVGEDVDSILNKLLIKADGDVKKLNLVSSM